jgi:hypothetical protein
MRACVFRQGRRAAAANAAAAPTPRAPAGLGLFLRGAAPPGSLVALFPGLVYSRQDYRRMPGYPKARRPARPPRGGRRDSRAAGGGRRAAA